MKIFVGEIEMLVNWGEGETGKIESGAVVVISQMYITTIMVVMMMAMMVMLVMMMMLVKMMVMMMAMMVRMMVMVGSFDNM